MKRTVILYGIISLLIIGLLGLTYLVRHIKTVKEEESFAEGFKLHENLRIMYMVGGQRSRTMVLFYSPKPRFRTADTERETNKTKVEYLLLV